MARKKTSKLKSNNPLVSPYLDILTKLAGGDKKIGQGLLAGAELGAKEFAPGSGGRLNEDVLSDPRIAKALQLTEGAVDNPLVDSGLEDALAAARKSVDSSSLDSAENQYMLNNLKSQIGSAGNLTDLEKEMLDIRRGALGGLTPERLVAMREGGSYDENGGFVAGESAIGRALTSALRSLKTSNLVSGGPRGRSAAVGARPAIANALQSTADLNRRLILDDYNVKKSAENDFVDTAGGINTNIYGANGRINTANTNYSNFIQNTNQIHGQNVGMMGQVAERRANTYENSRQNRLNSYQQLVGNISEAQVYRQQFNMEQLAREKAGFLGSVFGAGGFSAAQAGRNDAMDIAEKQLKAAQSFGGGGRGGWGGNNGTSDSGSADSFEAPPQ